jgi:hypothetical protein
MHLWAAQLFMQAAWFEHANAIVQQMVSLWKLVWLRLAAVIEQLIDAVVAPAATVDILRTSCNQLSAAHPGQRWSASPGRQPSQRHMSAAWSRHRPASGNSSSKLQQCAQADVHAGVAGILPGWSTLSTDLANVL